MNAVAELPPAEIRRALDCAPINRLEAELAQFEQVEMPLNHLFVPGAYIREILIKKGTLCTSKIHRTKHAYIISLGKIAVWTPGDAEWSIIGAPFTGVTMPGTRRVLYALTDVIWSTIHPTTQTDLAIIESQIIEPHHIPFPIGVPQIKELQCMN